MEATTSALNFGFVSTGKIIPNAEGLKPTSGLEVYRLFFGVGKVERRQGWGLQF